MSRETERDDARRTQALTASLGASLDPDRPIDRFERVVGEGLHASDPTRPPHGHTYPRKG